MIFVLVQELDNAIFKCYHNEQSKKTIITDKKINNKKYSL